jgi:hypothetical protein
VLLARAFAFSSRELLEFSEAEKIDVDLNTLFG